VSDLFYGGRLKDAPAKATSMQWKRDSLVREIVGHAPCQGSVLGLFPLEGVGAWCNTEWQNKSRFNILSALLAVGLALECDPTHSVGIITPYAAQARLLNRILQDLGQDGPHIVAATVHRFQGQEKNVILFDSVDGEPQKKAGVLLMGGHGSTAMRLVNVAITRAQGKFIALVDREFLSEKHPATSPLRQLLDHQMFLTKAEVLPGAWPESSWQGAGLKGAVRMLIGPAGPQTFGDDIAKAQQSLNILAPTGPAASSPLFSELQPSLTGGLRLSLNGSPVTDFVAGVKHGAHQIGPDCRLSAILDREILWLHLSGQADWFLRLRLPKAVSLLTDYWQASPGKALSPEKTVSAVPECPEGHGRMILRNGRHGVFWSCACYPSCRETAVVRAEHITALACEKRILCPRGHQMVGRQAGQSKTIFLGCSEYPRCEGTKPLAELIAHG